MCSENHLHFDYVRLAWDAGFCFEEYNTKNAFDVSTLGLVDIDKVTRERDIATVERHIPTILQFRLDEELTRILEPTFVKIFKLCQLSLQYLRFCNKYLDNTVIILKKDLSSSNDENIKLSNTIEQLKIENNNLNIKNKELKEAFNNFNQSVSFKCHECAKSFASEDYLHAHISRRHDSPSSRLQSESEKLQLEIKELKERLNSTEKYIQNEKDEPNNDKVFDDKEALLQAKFEQLKEHIEKELTLLRDESFYRSMYEKWFEEIFVKLKYETPKKVFVEQGSGDCARFTESGTQTNIAEEPAEVVPKQAQTVEKVGLNEELEQRLRSENDAQREMLERLLEQKIVGSLDKLETQMNVFGRRLEDMELQKQEAAKPSAVVEIVKRPEIINSPLKDKPKQLPIPTKVDTSVPKRRYLTAVKITNSSETESDSESENVPPKPARRTLKPSTFGDKTAVAPIRVASFNRQQGDFVIDRKKPIKVASFSKNDCKEKKSHTAVEKSDDCSEISKSSADFKVIKTVQQSSLPKKIEAKPKPHPRNANRAVLKENVQKPQKKQLSDESETSEENIPVVKASAKVERTLPSYDEESLEGLKEELEEIFNLRLKEIGVAPQWKGLPMKNFKHAISVIEHQASLSSKSIPNFSKIREEIVKAISKEVRNANIRGTKEVMQKSKSKTISNNHDNSNGHSINQPESKNDAVKVFQNASLSSSDLHSSSADEVMQPNKEKTTSKKKVLFNLKREDSVITIKAMPHDFAGSASSLGSSVLDRNDRDGVEEDGAKVIKGLEKEESEWDISDIVA